MATIHGDPSPGDYSHPTGVGSGRGLVRIGRWSDRRNRGNGSVRRWGRIVSRGYGKGGGGIRRVGRQSNRSN